MCMCMHVCVCVLGQEGTASSGDVIDFREYAYNVSRGHSRPNYFCVRLSFNGVHLKQLCDPNDEVGRMTGRVPDAMHAMWAHMKAAHWVDYQTRVLSITLTVRSNHANVKTRLTMMLQLTSLGGVLPSFEFLSRFDTVDYAFTFTVRIGTRTLTRRRPSTCTEAFIHVPARARISACASARTCASARLHAHVRLHVHVHAHE